MFGSPEAWRSCGQLSRSKGNSHWQGRIANVTDDSLELDLSTVKKRKNKSEASDRQEVTIAFSNILKANLVPEM